MTENPRTSGAWARAVQTEPIAGRREITKWIALLAMALDHAGKTVTPSLLVPLHFVGRLAFPLFAVVIAERLAAAPDLRGRYLRRLALWGLVAQPAYAAVARSADGNIMFTLGLGVLLDLVVGELRSGHARRSVLAAALGIAAVLAATRCDYGVAGVVLIPVLARLERWRAAKASLACGPLAFVVNAIGSPVGLHVHLGALLATPMALWLRETPVAMRRPHRYFFYAFYPLHLYLLAWWS